MTASPCSTCGGTGTVTERRSRWIGGTRTGYESRVTLEVRCDDCRGRGTGDWPADALWVEDRSDADAAAEAAYLDHLDRLVELDASAERAAPSGEVA